MQGDENMSAVLLVLLQIVVVLAVSIPDMTHAVARFRANHPTDQPAAQQEDEFEGIPAVERQADVDRKKTYFQIGPRDGVEMPEGGWKVLLILPGGDGSADFHPFCRRIHMHALPEDYIAVQLVAHAWSNDEDRVIWPSAHLNPQRARFTTEEFIAAVVEDLKKYVEINDQLVFAFGWSSGGPAVYANSVAEGSPVTGSFVAMSVFRPRYMGNDLSAASGHPYFVLHSPDDAMIPIDEHARRAVRELDEAGATTHLQTYPGGHGWVNDPYGHIRRGIEWLQEQQSGD
jgi:predicted esterase